MSRITDEMTNQIDTTTIVPNGIYTVSIESMGITLKNNHLMFATLCKIKEGDQKGGMIFFKRVISGNSSAKWTDGQAIKSVCTWVNKLLAEDEAPVSFINYQDFADQILDVFQEVKGIELVVDYHHEYFTPISIMEVHHSIAAA